MSKWIRAQRKPERIANRDACAFVSGRRAFIGSNIYSEDCIAEMPDDDDESRPMGEMMYAVYSYGRHWPLYIYHEDTGVWYENEDRHSVTTSKHRTQARPNAPTRKVSRGTMLNLLYMGLVGTVCEALEPA